MNVTILGAGAYALALSDRFLKNNCKVTVWTKIIDEYNMLKTYKCNKKVLPNYFIDDKIILSNNIDEAIDKANLIVIAIPVKFIRDVVIEMKPYYKKEQHICIASKGVEQNNYLFPYIIVNKILRTKKVGVISGGTFAVDMVHDVPLGLVVASKNSQTSKLIKKSLSNKLLDVHISSDVLGIEFWGAVKNIIAIGCGIVDGMDFPESTMCLFFTKCFNDVMNLVYGLGGNKKSALTYAGIGDLFLTCTSLKSRNYTYGKLIGKKADKDEIDKYIKETTIEGRYTLKAFYEIIHKKKKSSLIIDIIYDIVYNDADVSILNNYLEEKKYN